MAVVENVGALEWDTENKSDDLRLVLYLNEPLVGEGEIDESETWNFETGTISIETAESQAEIESDYDFERDRPLLLPRNIRWGLCMMIAGLRCTKLAYHWSGGKRVNIHIVGYTLPIRHRAAFLRALANRFSEIAENMLVEEQAHDMLLQFFGQK